MAMVPFYQIVGRRAADETRTVIVPEGMELPAGRYGFLEFYCDDAECDCRRVIFQVWREDMPGKIWATITYGWETPEYYARWSLGARGAEAEVMASATLEQISPQTELSIPLLGIFEEVLLSDPDYVARLKRHYREACPGRVSKVYSAPSGPNTPRRLAERRRARERSRHRR